MHSTSVYGLKLLVLEGGGGKALATDHREFCPFMSLLGFPVSIFFSSSIVLSRYFDILVTSMTI